MPKTRPVHFAVALSRLPATATNCSGRWPVAVLELRGSTLEKITLLDSELSIGYDPGVAKKPKLISEQLREVMLAADVSRYRIAKDIDVTEALLSRFINGVAGLGQETIDKIGEYLGLRLIGPKQRKRKPKSKGK